MTELTYVVQQPQTRKLKDRLTFAVRHRSGVRKLFKLSFRPKSADFYIFFPYVDVPSYRCGVRHSSLETETFDTSPGEDVSESNVQVKFSFHESGIVHCKAQDNAPHGGTTLARTRSYPFALLSGQHVFTAEFDCVDAFHEAMPEEVARKDFLSLDIAPDAVRVKVTAYAGYSEASVTGKYSSADGIALPASTTTQFTRSHLPRPLYVGFYVAAGATLQATAEPQPTILSLAGFSPEENSFLFLHANDPAR